MAHCVFDEVMNRHPNADIHWHTMELYHHAIRYPGLNPINPAYTIVAWPGSKDEELTVYEDMKRYCRLHYDKVYIPQHYPDHPNLPAGEHLIDRMYRHAGFEPRYPRRINFRPTLHEVAEARGVINEIDGPYITVNLNGVSSGRALTVEQVQEIAYELAVEVVTGDETVPGCKRADVSFAAWREIIANSELHIGGCTGTKWLAASTQVPQIVIDNSIDPGHLVGLREARIKDDGLISVVPPNDTQAIIEQARAWCHQEAA